MRDEPEMSMKERLAALASLAPAFEGEGFNFGAMECRPGVMPYFIYSPEAHRFLDAAQRMVIRGFDWPTWAHGPEGQRFARDPAAIATADTETLRKLLTAFIRQERFCEGSLASACASGHLAAIARRARELHDQMND